MWDGFEKVKDKFNHIKSQFESSSRWQTTAGMHFTHFEYMKWLIAEVEHLRETLRRLEPEKPRICGNCDHWQSYGPPTGSVGDCLGRGEIVSTFSDYHCAVGSWTAKHPKPELPGLPETLDNGSINAIDSEVRRAINDIVNYLKAKETSNG